MSEKNGTRSAEPPPAADVDRSRRDFVTRAGKLAYTAPVVIVFSLAMSNDAAASDCPPPPDPQGPGCPH
jgi:hypothetical protein